jgi:hypothetical protein
MQPENLRSKLRPYANRPAANVIWIMKSGRVPCQNASMVIDQVRTAAGTGFFRFSDHVAFRLLRVSPASSDIDYS